MKELVLAAALALTVSACATASVGGRVDWRCDGGSAFSVRIKSTGRAEVFAGGRVYDLPHVESLTGARYSDGTVEYMERAGEATLTGARGGPYANCRH